MFSKALSQLGPIHWEELSTLRVHNKVTQSVHIQIFLVRIFPHSDWIRTDTRYLSVFSLNTGTYGPEKLQIWTFFTQCELVKKTLKNNFIERLAIFKYKQETLAILRGIIFFFLNDVLDNGYSINVILCITISQIIDSWRRLDSRHVQSTLIVESLCSRIPSCHLIVQSQQWRN